MTRTKGKRVMAADTFLAIQKVANGWVALPDGASDLTAVVQVFTTPDDLAGFVMGWALQGMGGARPVPDAPAGSANPPPAPPYHSIYSPFVIGPATGPPPEQVTSAPPPQPIPPPAPPPVQDSTQQPPAPAADVPPPQQ